jgi:hypothetical protein
MGTDVSMDMDVDMDMDMGMDTDQFHLLISEPTAKSNNLATSCKFFCSNLDQCHKPIYMYLHT